MREHLENVTVFKRTSKTVQNELLDCMLAVLRKQIVDEVKTTEFLAIQADETTDISTHCQLVLVHRWTQQYTGAVLWIHQATQHSIASALLESLHSILPEGQEKKLIAQAYNGAAVMRGATGGVQWKVQNFNTNAHYIHCYAHQLNLVMQQATSHIPQISHFFTDMGGINFFFLKIEQENCSTRWDGGTLTSKCIVNTSELQHSLWAQDDLVNCSQTIRNSEAFDGHTKREAGGYVRMLEDEAFYFFLALLHKIMPHVDMLYNQLQKRNIDAVFIAGITQIFINRMQAIRYVKCIIM